MTTTAALLLSATRVLNARLIVNEQCGLSWNSPEIAFTPAFVARLKDHKSELQMLCELRCQMCNAFCICEEAVSYRIAYCSNGCGTVRRESKQGFTEDDAREEQAQLDFEITERLALMTEDGSNEADALDQLCRQVITKLFTSQEPAKGVVAA